MKKTIVFVDANNWYHNVKSWFRPSDIDIKKVINFIATKKNLDILEIRWYASMPNMQDNELIYKRQRAFLGSLQKQGIKIITRKLQKLSNKEIIKKRKDFIPSFDLIQKQDNEVLSASVPRGYSSELRQKFPFLIIKKEDLSKCLKDYKSKDGAIQ